MKRAPMKTDLTVEYARKLFGYDPATGDLLHYARAHVAEGTKAGSVNKVGYVIVKVHQKSYVAHRIIWLIVTGQWPEAEIDHINNNKADNRWINLRPATHSQNKANSNALRQGLKGAYKPKGMTKWRAIIRVSGRNKHLGYFDDEQDAHLAYLSAARAVFGEFANAGAA